MSDGMEREGETGRVQFHVFFCILPASVERDRNYKLFRFLFLFLFPCRVWPCLSFPSVICPAPISVLQTVKHDNHHLGQCILTPVLS